MYTIDIFIRTYVGDFEILKQALQSIKDNVSGFRNLIICVKENDYKILKQFLNLNNFNDKYIKVQTDTNYNLFYSCNAPDYCGQQITKLKADMYSDADFILFSDSDVIYFEKFDIKQNFFIDKKMIYLHRKWESSYIVWQECLKYLGILTEYEFMCRLPLMYPRFLITKVREFILSKTNNTFHDECFNIYTKYGFSEFNIMGSLMFKWNTDLNLNVEFVDIATYSLTHVINNKQFWSYDTPELLNKKINTCLLIKSELPFNSVVSKTEIDCAHHHYYSEHVIENLNSINYDVKCKENCEEHIIKGFKFFTHVNDTCIADTIKTGILHEKFILSYVKQFIDSTKNIIDLGANIGTHSVIYSQYTTGIVYSFEPQKTIYDILNLNILANNCKNIISHNFGASNCTKKFYMNAVYNAKHNQGAFRILTDDDNNEEIEIEIECKKLDDLNLENIGFIKIDVEGHEYEALDGLKLTLLKFKPVILIEIHDSCKTRQKTLKLLFDLGYANFYKLSHADYIFTQ